MSDIFAKTTEPLIIVLIGENTIDVDVRKGMFLKCNVNITADPYSAASTRGVYINGDLTSVNCGTITAKSKTAEYKSYGLVLTSGANYTYCGVVTPSGNSLTLACGYSAAFGPDDPLIRTQTAVILQRFCETIVE